MALVLAACARPRDKCERLARRLMPNPDPAFIEQCVSRSDEAKFVKTVDCLLAVEGGVYDADIERCGGGEQLPLYFQF